MINPKPVVRSSRVQTWKRLATIAFTTYMGALGVLMFFERLLLFPAPPVQHGFWQADNFGAEEFFVPSADKTKVHVWSLLKTNANKTLIFCHGNGETLGVLGEELAEIRDNWDVNVVAFDFRGYGKTGGLANESDILADAIAVGRWIESNESFHGHQLIALGRSLGGAAAIEIALHSKIDGLILDRTFSSIVDVAAERYPIFPIRLVMRNQFCSIDKIPQCKCALLQMHGDVDEIVPYRFGRKLFDACTLDRKEFLTSHGLRHNDPWPNEFWMAGKKFIEDL